jgi:hypothetical protein
MRPLIYRGSIELIDMVLRCYVLLILIAAISGSLYGQVTRIVTNRPADLGIEDSRIETLRFDATSMYDSLKDQDYERFADFAHPRSLEHFGGREAFVESMRSSFKSTRSTLASLEVTIGMDITIFNVDSQLFGLVPTTLDGTTSEMKKVVQEGTVVGISTDSGKSWKFVNGNSFAQFFPEYANAIKIPKQRSFIDGVETND